MGVSKSVRLAGLLAAISLGGTGCFNAALHDVPPSKPVVRSFTASPGTILPGGSSVLSWSVSGATTVAIQPDPGPTSGTSVTVTPAVTTLYTLTATNAGGSSQSTVTVTIALAPTITVQPSAAAVVPPATATFTVVATGTGALAYQWQRNGASIPGATSASFTTPPTAGSDCGTSFRVVVTDSLGSTVTSNGASLTTQGFSSTGSMASGREFHTATLLADGRRVLVVGGSDGNVPLDSAEIFDEATGTFTSAGRMAAPRQGHSAALLADGRVLVTGGLSTNAYLATSEIYDPGTGIFTATASMPEARMNFPATSLVSGTVLVAGGFAQTGGGTTTVDLFLDTAALFDAASPPAFPPTGSHMATGRESPVAVLLQGGRVLVAGGYAGPTGGVLASAEVYDPVLDSFVPTSNEMSSRRQNGTATRLGDGRVLLAGGFDGAAYVATADLYDPGASSFAATGSLLRPGPTTSAVRGLHTASLLPNGKVLVAGGTEGIVPLASVEVYSTAPGSFALAPGQDLIAARYAHTATPLADGRVLVVGGRNDRSTLSSAEIWTNVP